MLGFSPDGHPVASALLFRSLLYWEAFEGSSSQVFDCVVNTIKAADKTIDPQVTVYWLSSTLSLYRLIQDHEKVIAAGGSSEFATGESDLDRLRAKDNEYGIEVFKVKLSYCVAHQYQLLRDSTRAKLMGMLRGENKVRSKPFP